MAERVPILERWKQDVGFGTMPDEDADARAEIFGFDPRQPRDREGKWRETGVDSLPRGPKNALGYRPIKVGDDLDLAVKLLTEGEPIELDQPEEAATLIERLGDIAKGMRERGEKEPVFDLCKVTVPGTNLFCHDSVGLPRIEMPQLKGVPTPGTEADKMPRDKYGDVDLGPAFRKYLEGKGVEFENAEVPSENLKATQNELSGAKVADLLDFVEAGNFEPGSYFVSKDNYILDGHHRWATQVAEDLQDNEPGDITSKVERANIGIGSLLWEALKFAEEKGIPQAGVANPLKQTAMAADWNPADHPRDAKGRFRKVPGPGQLNFPGLTPKPPPTYGSVGSSVKTKMYEPDTLDYMGGGTSPSFKAELTDGTPVQIKLPPDEDRVGKAGLEVFRSPQHQQAATRIADYFGVETPRSASRDPVELGVADDIENLVGYFPDGDVTVTEWVPGFTEAFEFEPNVSYYDGEAISVFDRVIGNTDRHDGQWGQDENGIPVVVDHDLAFPKQVTTDWGNYLGFTDENGADLNGYEPLTPGMEGKLEDFTGKDWPLIEEGLREDGLTREEILATRLRAEEVRDGGVWPDNSLLFEDSPSGYSHGVY